MDYRNKSLPPIIRMFRLLTDEYGADIRHNEEIIDDHKMLKCVRRRFHERGTCSVVVTRTCAEEKDRVVFQMGTSNAVRALTNFQFLSVVIDQGS